MRKIVVLAATLAISVGLASPAAAKKKPPPEPFIKVKFEEVIITSQGGGTEHICVFSTPSGHFKRVSLAACQAPGHASTD